MRIKDSHLAHTKDCTCRLSNVTCVPEKGGTRPGFNQTAPNFRICIMNASSTLTITPGRVTAGYVMQLGDLSSSSGRRSP
ncbi:hypothetical protein PAXRUDRAFT_827856 [Paxillus rubicundulus Ve08.2h10]|uniref:Uncharacterized protein n=1 Tax=Paxillus rubicundulus Ve08.2h10 TaxID=930991 RepID=A0A0D0DQE3_9AGAM|nr:hypothetical protein PAXRUDRAFT_827856 [Paxillus rubicundulus Ve08.2h10]